MNARRTLAALFNRLVKDNIIPVNPVIRTTKMKQSAHANVPYSRTQLRVVMDQTKASNPNLYLCCLLTYGTFLRPHQEIRLLTRSAFNEDMSVITLGGNRNKSRRMRTVPVPDYARQRMLQENLGSLAEDCNIFTRCITPFNMSYFSTAWTRLKTELVEQRLITANHTLYSFRHTAAVNMYLKTKDPFKIQRALGHSSLTVTLTYLRSLGLMVDSSLEDLPDL
jgi:integrase